MKDLMKWTQEQKLKLENQNQQLADLQKQVSLRAALLINM